MASVIYCHLYTLIFWRWRLKKTGSNLRLYKPLFIRYPSKISFGDKCILLHNSRFDIHPGLGVSDGVTIGSHVHIGNNLFISCSKSIKIGSGVLISDNVAIIDNSHIHVAGMSPISTGIKSDNILIGKNVAIYRNSTILAGVTIGDGAVIGANSLVNRNVPPNEIWAGSPAKYIGDVFKYD